MMMAVREGMKRMVVVMLGISREKEGGVVEIEASCCQGVDSRIILCCGKRGGAVGLRLS